MLSDENAARGLTSALDARKSPIQTQVNQKIADFRGSQSDAVLMSRKHVHFFPR